MALRYDEPTKASSLTISSAKRINQTLQEMLGGSRMVLPWYEPLRFELFTAEPDDHHRRLNWDIVAIGMSAPPGQVGWYMICVSGGYRDKDLAEKMDGRANGEAIC